MRRNKRLRRLSRSPAAKFSARQAQLPSLVLHDLLWTQKSKLSRSTRTASRSQILPNKTSSFDRCEWLPPSLLSFLSEPFNSRMKAKSTGALFLCSPDEFGEFRDLHP